MLDVWGEKDILHEQVVSRTIFLNYISFGLFNILIHPFFPKIILQQKPVLGGAEECRGSRDMLQQRLKSIWEEPGP